MSSNVIALTGVVLGSLVSLPIRSYILKGNRAMRRFKFATALIFLTIAGLMFGGLLGGRLAVALFGVGMLSGCTIVVGITAVQSVNREKVR